MPPDIVANPVTIPVEFQTPLAPLKQHSTNHPHPPASSQSQNQSWTSPSLYATTTASHPRYHPHHMAYDHGNHRHDHDSHRHHEHDHELGHAQHHHRNHNHNHNHQQPAPSRHPYRSSPILHSRDRVKRANANNENCNPHPHPSPHPQPHVHLQSEPRPRSALEPHSLVSSTPFPPPPCAYALDKPSAISFPAETATPLQPMRAHHERERERERYNQALPSPSPTPTSKYHSSAIDPSSSIMATPQSATPALKTMPVSTMSTPLAEASSSSGSSTSAKIRIKNEPKTPVSVTQLNGIQPPSPFPGPVPIGYARKDPVPSTFEVEMEEEDSRRPRQGAASLNPWDYLLDDGKDEDGKNKARRRFSRPELEALEVLWSISKNPSKYERQRLSAWFGVKTKHITVWFQNRRQEERRHQKETASGATPSTSRNNRGTYDPVTGKWRPVPLSCISSLQAPPEAKLATVNAIRVGALNREMYFDHYPEESTPRMTTSQETPTSMPSTYVRTPLLVPSASLDDVLDARESALPPHRRGRPVLVDEEPNENHRDLLSMMPSDPPSDAVDPSDADLLRARPKLPPLGLRPASRPGAAAELYLGRATSTDIFVAQRPKRGRNGSPSTMPRSISGPLATSASEKHYMIAPLPEHAYDKRARLDRKPVPKVIIKPRNSFSRSQSSSVLDTLGFRRSVTPAESLVSSRTASTSGGDSGKLASIEEGPRSPMMGSGEGEVRANGTHDPEVLNAASSLLDLVGGCSGTSGSGSGSGSDAGASNPAVGGRSGAEGEGDFGVEV